MVEFLSDDMVVVPADHPTRDHSHDLLHMMQDCSASDPLHAHIVAEGFADSYEGEPESCTSTLVDLGNGPVDIKSQIVNLRCELKAANKRSSRLMQRNEDLVKQNEVIRT